jgi:sugar/nucleoside kinase (ribokinase family)
MTGNPSRQATLAAVRYAKEEGKLISYDPNLRLMLWPSPEIARTTILQAMPLVDVLKISEEELLFLTGETDLNRGAGQLLSDYDLQLVLITLGHKGAYARNCLSEAWHPAFDVATIDTTGSGDAFTGSFLHQLLQAGKPPRSLTEDDLTAFLAFANAAGSLASTRKGAIPAMPTLAEIEDCLAHNQPLE